MAPATKARKRSPPQEGGSGGAGGGQSSNGGQSKKSKSSEEKGTTKNGDDVAQKRPKSTNSTTSNRGSRGNAQETPASGRGRPVPISTSGTRRSTTSTLGSPPAQSKKNRDVGEPCATPTSVQSSAVATPAASTPLTPVPAAILSHGRGRGSEESSLITENNTSLYNPTVVDPKKQHEQRMRDLRAYVRFDLFPYWKFFSSKKQMVFNNKKGGIVFKICNDLNVREGDMQFWWDTNQKQILNALNRKRNDVTAYLKKQFCCKF